MPFSVSLYKLIIFWIGGTYADQPNQPCSEGFKPIFIELRHAAVVGGKNEKISFFLFLKNHFYLKFYQLF